MTTYRDDNNLVLLRRAVTTTGELVAAIRPEQWHGATSCEDIDVLGLVAHLIGGLDSFAAVPASATMAAPEDGDGPQAPPEPVIEPVQAASAYSAAGLRMLTAWSAPDVLERAYPMPWGETKGGDLVGFMVIEQVTHGWDLARATGLTPTFDDALAEATLVLARTYDDATIRVPGMFGPVVPISDDASAIDRLAAFLGRHP